MSKQESTSTPEYGEKFETGIIYAMSVLILLAFIGVAVLWKTNPPHCETMKYTYCGEQEKPHH